MRENRSLVGQRVLRETWEIFKLWWLFVVGAALGIVAIIQAVQGSHESHWFWGFWAMTALSIAAAARLRRVVQERDAALGVPQDESLDRWLAERQTEMAKLRSQLADMVAAHGFQAMKAQSTESHFWGINDEVDRKLHISARGWVDYFNGNPSNFPTELTLVKPEQFHDYTLPLMDATITHIAYIRACLGEGRDGP